MGAKPLLPVALVWGLLLSASAQAVVSLNEACIDPPRPLDNGRKFIEFAGVPGMSPWPWNGGLHTRDQLGADGSLTMMLVRQPSGHVDGDPTNVAGLPTGRDITDGAELVSPLTEPREGLAKHQRGDGRLAAPGAAGETFDGNNCQDNAAQPWIGGEAEVGTAGQGDVLRLSSANNGVEG